VQSRVKVKFFVFSTRTKTMASSLALKRLDDLMDEIGNLKKNIDESSENVELRGIWRDISVEEKEIEEAKDSLFKEG